MDRKTPSVVVVIPCYNEATTVARVIADFRRELPEAEIAVYDNNSTDGTAALAREAGVRVATCRVQGKGAVVRQAFHHEEADIVVLVDGDDTYPAEASRALVEAVQQGADMAVGDRISTGHYSRENKRFLHGFGNALVCAAIRVLFRCRLQDVMSGYRAFSRRFYKTCPVLVAGFAVETEMSIHAVDKLFAVQEIPVAYRDRPAGSHSKLNTLEDGFRVLWSILWIFKDAKPLIFFSVIAGLQGLLAAAAAIYQLVQRSENPFAYPLGLALLTTGSITLFAGFVLDTLAKFHKEDFEVRLLSKSYASPTERADLPAHRSHPGTEHLRPPESPR